MADTAWFRDAKWGVFCHYLGSPPSSDGGKELTAQAWNAQIDAFDVDALTRQLVAVRAPYFFITIGQNSGHYLAPNHTYDRLTGITPSKCSKRDLVKDLYESLEPHGIRLMVYLPSGAPAMDPQACKKLEWEWGFQDGWPNWRGGRTGKRLVNFQRHWEAVIREWSLRWGRHVHGWWIDGCYFADEMYRHDDEPNFASFAAAMKAGNPQSIVAFNPGVGVPLVCHSEHEDYTAGEIADTLPAGVSLPQRWIMRGEHRAQLHVLSYLGATWCGEGRPRFPDAMAAGYTRHINDHEGVVTWDVPITKAGTIPQAFLDQLAALQATDD